MNRKISGGAYDIAFDKENNRFFLTSARTVRVFDCENNEKQATLKEVSNANQIYISPKHNLIVVKSTVGQFAFYNADDLSLIWKTKLRVVTNTDPDFVFEEDEKVVCGIGINGLNEFIYRIYPETRRISVIPLEKADGGSETDKPVTRYLLCGYEKGNFRRIRNFYDVGKVSRIYECFDGVYEEKGGKPVLKEKIFSTDEKILKLYDIAERQNSESIESFCKALKSSNYFLRTYRSDSGLFLITSGAIFRKTSNGFEEVYRAENISDYAEFKGRRYICTSNWCLVQNIN